MVNLKLFWKCMFSPALFATHKGPFTGKYDPSEWERLGDNLITTVYFLWNVGVYTSPLLMFVMSRRGYFTTEGVVSLVKFSIGLSVLVGASYCMRSYGRIHNMKYQAFLNSLEKMNEKLSEGTRREIKRYDFEFYAWPVDFKNKATVEEKKRERFIRKTWSRMVQSPCSILGYLVLHSFGIRLIYPGSIRALSYALGPTLVESRKRLVEKENGERFKLLTSDGNYIDSMFIDKRSEGGNGRTLVICSEGNAGFYEYGIMSTPIDAGYSVLGWNHPGFAASSGMPYPEEEQTAMDTVVQFALHLDFKPEQIVLYGWSIGGYTTSWAAMTYPEVKAVILDATFDDLLPLAIPRMPASLEPVVRMTIRQYANLDIARLIVHYPGPIKLFRRSEDEVICIEPNVLSTNRGNNLLMKLLQHRYPYVVDETTEGALGNWLATTASDQVAVYNSYNVSDKLCLELLSGYLDKHPHSFPVKLGQNMDQDLKTKLALWIASKYMEDFHTSHCTPLPGRMFQIPTLSFI